MWLGLALVLAAFRRRPSLFVAVLAADAVAELLAKLLKLTNDERRPAARFSDLHALVPIPKDSSFPSGHTATSFACATVLAVLAPRFALGFVLLACAIGYSRLYVAVHYPLDVVAGAAVGVVAGLVVLFALRRRSGAPGPEPRPDAERV